MKVWILHFLLILIPITGFAQPLGGPPEYSSDQTISTFYFEVGGNATFASFNYDLTLNNNYGIRIGASPGLFFAEVEDDNSESDYNYDFVGLIGAFKLHNVGAHKFETGIGAVFGESITPRNDTYPAVPALVVNIGYRFVTKKHRGLSIRGMFTPSYSKNGFVPWFGTSIGISFQNKNK
ncbi:MAG: hypothetical protein JJ971_11070 [Balneolaceae bacterium]|nr:hypothetical protein [Balneolaceae bacterium]MBO6546211.1 hypothetical protein [Balneolaceae bacterium]MBO6648570.1 hypothetical protein [Balneolaceae bacterium]